MTIDPIRARIAAVVQEHRVIEVGMGCDGCSCDPSKMLAYSAHVADVVAEALALQQVWTPISCETSEPQWNEWYDDRRQAEKAVAQDGGVVGTAWVTAWEPQP